MKNKKTTMNTTSWEPVEQWYKSIVQDEGHYFHKQIIMPGVIKLAGKFESVLDLACGTGVLAQYMPTHVEYVGIDICSSFIKAATETHSLPTRTFQVGDVTKSLNLKKINFSLATLILAVQNIQVPLNAFKNIAKHLEIGAKFILVLNHPCFRIPRQSSWGVDSTKKIQYRRIDRYNSTMEIPVQAHPSQGEQSASTWSFHYPLAHIINWLFEAGFVTEIMEEWCSNKQSSGKNGKMENNSRNEIPLFLALRTTKFKGV